MMIDRETPSQRQGTPTSGKRRRDIARSIYRHKEGCLTCIGGSSCEALRRLEEKLQSGVEGKLTYFREEPVG